MGIFDKIKNVLFEEEEQETPVIKNVEEKIEPKVKTEEVAPTRFKSSQEEVVQEKKAINVEVSPFQTFDEEEFDRIAAINRNRLLERDRKAREQKEAEKKRLEQEKRMEERKTREYSHQTNNSSRDYSSYLKNDNKSREQHRFKPSPVISPVYGILDKNYKKEDILPRASSEGTLPKVMDVDRVRQKAFGALEEELATNDYNNLKEDSEEIIDLKDLKFGEAINLEENNPSEVKITNYDFIKESNDEEIVNKEDSPKYKPEEDTLENDLFNLIDSMYENRKEDN